MTAFRALCNTVARTRRNTGARIVPLASIHTSRINRDEDHEWKLREADPARRETEPALYEFGKYVSSVLPKYVQQYSVWKDEL
ncbi:hypothetical protein GGF43_006315, partial [Coemansia sp. RSA 2618]